MKKLSKFLGIPILFLSVIGAAHAEWQVQIIATGEVNPAPNVFSVSLGDSSEQLLLPAPPRPPQYTTYLELYEPDWASGPYLVMIYESNMDSLVWLLQVDPNGNVMPPTSRTTVLSWDSSVLPESFRFYMQDYLTGQILVPDMHQQDSFSVTASEDQYFNIVGIHTITGLQESADPPVTYTIISNFPNPFNPATTISYPLTSKSYVDLRVYDITGKLVAILVNNLQDAGLKCIPFDGSGLASGIYIYRIKTDQYQVSGKMFLLK